MLYVHSKSFIELCKNKYGVFDMETHNGIKNFEKVGFIFLINKVEYVMLPNQKHLIFIKKWKAIILHGDLN